MSLATHKRPAGNGNGVVAERLRLHPSTDHNPENYDDLQSEFNPLLFSSLERYLPPSVLNLSRDSKIQFMKEILLRYSSEGERTRIQKHREYRQKIISNYQPLHRELYTVNAANFFLPSFMKAITENTEESFRNALVEPTPGVFVFEMLQPKFCEMLMSEVENFERWVHDAKFRIMRPNTMNNYGAVLDDFGLETMLDKLMDEYIRPMSKLFFPEVGGLTLDSHHGFVVEYGVDRDVELGVQLHLCEVQGGDCILMRQLFPDSDIVGDNFVHWVSPFFITFGFHVDDSEVTLNVCLSKQFVGGDLFFRGVRCDKHVNTETQPEEILDYVHVQGHAVLHRGRHRHGARATTSGRRVNLILWCRSSVFRELKKYQKDFSSWCGECRREKKERQRLSITATKLELLKRDRISAS